MKTFTSHILLVPRSEILISLWQFIVQKRSSDIYLPTFEILISNPILYQSRSEIFLLFKMTQTLAI